MACRPAPAPPLPTLMPVAALPTAGAPAAVATLPATLTPLPGPTAPPLPPTAAPQTVPALPAASPSAAPSPTPAVAPADIVTTTVPAAPAAPSPAAPADPEACRSLEALAGVTPRWLVRPGPWPRGAAVPGLLGRAADDGRQLIHLGFDLEGEPDFLDDLLAVLDRRQVRTTMFILGSWAATYPEWVQEMARRGHEMATHGYSHGDMSQMDAGQVRSELRRTERVVNDLTGQSTIPWFRPPFGAYSDASLQAAYSAGYTTVIWAGSANDWRRGADADSMCRALLAFGWPGAILYAHANRADIIEAVDRFIGEMQARGFTFVPLSVLMAPDPAVWLEPSPPAAP